MASREIRSRQKIARSFLLLFSLLMPNLTSCSASGDPQRSAWMITDEVMTEAFEAQETPHEFTRQSAVYLTDEARSELETIRERLGATRPLGLISLSDHGRGEWIGDYAYMIGSWPSLVRLTLRRQAGRSDQPWRIHSLPYLDAYTKLSHLVSAEDEGILPTTSPERLPVIREGALWTGGLGGRDQRGRPLSNVLVVWTPPLAYVDGEPLQGVASRASLSIKLSEAFTQRQKLAEQAQASYTPHVSLALTAGTSASTLVELISWCEGLGAERISLLARSSDGPKLIYLSARQDQAKLITPQRIVHAYLNSGDAHLTIKRTDRQQREDTEDHIALMSIEERSESKRDEGLRSYLSLLERARTQEELDGISIHISKDTTMSEVFYFFDLSRQIDQSLPITMAPYRAESKGQ